MDWLGVVLDLAVPGVSLWDIVPLLSWTVGVTGKFPMRISEMSSTISMKETTAPGVWILTIFRRDGGGDEGETL